MLIDELVGHRVLDARRETDGIFLTCDDGTRISVFNPLLTGEDVIESYIGVTIRNVIYDNESEKFIIFFEKCKPISVDLRECVFCGPEAIVIAKGNDIIVFD